MLPHHAPRCVPPVSVTLRDVRQTDLPSLFAFESDPAWCAMAMVKPRSKEVFDAVWEKILTDRTEGTTPPGVLQQAIIADGELCGTIGCHLRDGRCNVGYGLHQKHWGRGIASRALPLLLAEVALRPLYATAAVSNAASIRVLMKCGFVIAGARTTPETDRCMAREEVSMVLA